MDSNGSKIFSPFKAIGLVSDGSALELHYVKQKKHYNVITIIGNTFYTYSADKLRLVDIGVCFSNRITCLASNNIYVFTASGNIIYGWKRSKNLKHKYVGDTTFHLILPFGPHLVAVDDKNVLKVWEIGTESLSLEIEFPVNSFFITSLLHPLSYMNKVLVGSRQGQLILWNLNTNKSVYTFKGWGSAVTVLEQSPAIDVVAVGLANGTILLHNLKYDETVLKFTQEWGSVTSITFRTDGQPVMASGSELGHIAIWNLEEKRFCAQIRNAHTLPVTKLKCLMGEPLMISTSSDNTLKLWIFDLPDLSARLFNVRQGFSDCPQMAKFHDNSSEFIIVSGNDSTIRVYSTISDTLNKNLGKASVNRKAVKSKGLSKSSNKDMSPVIYFSAESVREKSWDNLAAIHRDEKVITTWSTYLQKMGKHKLIHERFHSKHHYNTTPTCLKITVCGNFVCIGYSSGDIDKYNIQSGIYQGSFGNPRAHEGSITSIATDGYNKIVLSGDPTGCIKWWNLKERTKLSCLQLDSGLIKIVLHRESGLFVAILDDWSVLIMDISTRKIVRNFCSHTNQILDCAFTPDSKWVITSSLDKTIRTWDIPSSFCIDCFKVNTPAISISVSPVGEFIATLHVDELGVYLWSNLACFGYIPLRPLLNDFVPMVLALPSMAADVDSAGFEEEMEENITEEIDDNLVYVSPNKISEDLVTLALLPTSRWLNLLKLDTIKLRNKPKQPPKTFENAPFFLPTVPGLSLKFAGNHDELNNNNNKYSHHNKPVAFEILTEFGEKLKVFDYSNAFSNLLKMGPSATEVEIRSLDPNIGGSKELIHSFLKMLHWAINQRVNMEAVEGYLSLFLKIHSDYIINDNQLLQSSITLSEEHNSVWENMYVLFNQSQCLISYLKNTVLIN